MMKKVMLSLVMGCSLYSADPQNVLSEVVKLRQKYEECKTEQSHSKTIDISRYNGAIGEVAQQKAVIQSLEKTLESRDRRYRELLNEYEKVKIEAHAGKVSKIERQNLTASLEKAKSEIESLKALINRTKTSSKAIIQEKIVEKVVYKDRPVVQEKIVTKTVEPTEKISALQHELDAAKLTIERLKKNTKAIVQEKIVEKVVYKDRPVIQEKIVEKVVYKDRPVVQEKIVTKTVEPTVKLAALQHELDAAKLTIERLKKNSKPVVQEKIVEKVVYKDRPVVQEKKVAVAKVSDVRKPVVNVDKPIQKSKSSVSHAYRISGNAPIYNAPGGVQIDTWEDRRSFTAGNPVNGWVHISGYFVNRVWQPAGDNENFWVRESDVIRR